MVDVSNVLVDNGCISMQMQSCRGRGPGGMLAYMGGFVWVRWEPHKERLGAVAQACNPSTWEVNVGGSGVQA